ncbi:MAG TPA: HAMP domain-containing sensor histidine kinase [Steroidobacteraceae bacterium]|nr:HAMP domain-containing sensor histidine kinase [Steroidobacteraceae bacterium]
MEALIGGHDWASSSLGPTELWPPSLRTVVGICLHAPQPMLVTWGEELCMLFNDAWRSLHGAQALGQPLAAHLPAKVEAFRTVLATGLPMEREGSGLIPVRDEKGIVRGVMVMPCAHQGIAQAIGHDLRNPLATILTAAQLVERRAGDDERLLEPARRIIAGSERMSRMLEQLVEYMHLQADKLTLKRASVDVTGVVRDAIDSVRAGALQWPVSFEAAGDARAELDPERLRQLVRNLVGNAAGHVPQAACRVRVDSSSPAYVAVSVENDGELPEGVTLFEAFSSSGPAKGVGLGLYLVRALVEAHGGTVTAQSKGGVTRVTVLLPRQPPGA